jgi:hypothetical protein
MEIVKFQRELEQHQAHINRIRNITATLDTSRPESLGLKHLALRPKKMQLMEDRRQTVAKENAKLMELMTKTMNERRDQPKRVRLPSLNEPIRRRTVDSINFENKLLMHRLKTVPAVINRTKLEKDFEHHLKAEKNLRRRQMKPLSLPKDLHASSPLKLRGSQNGNSEELFNASIYTSQRGHLLKGSSLDSLDQSQTLGIKSVSDFRREIIASKKQAQLTHTRPMQNDSPHHQQVSGLQIGEMYMSTDSLPIHHTNHSVTTNQNHLSSQQAQTQSNKRPGPIFEMTHTPGATL